MLLILVLLSIPSLICVILFPLRTHSNGLVINVSIYLQSDVKGKEKHEQRKCLYMIVKGNLVVKRKIQKVDQNPRPVSDNASSIPVWTLASNHPINNFMFSFLILQT
jgi:hypothetical protein